MALLDVDMTGVKPAGEFQELGVGEYLMRVLETEKKGTKDKFDEDGNAHPDNGKNFYLQITSEVASGPDEGAKDFERLNIWNSNKTAVDIAKSTLKSIQMALGVYSNNSEDFHGKYFILTIKLNAKNQHARYYSPAPAHMIPVDPVDAHFAAQEQKAAYVPPVAQAAPAQAAAQPTAQPAAQPVAQAAARDPKAKPTWATKKA